MRAYIWKPDDLQRDYQNPSFLPRRLKPLATTYGWWALKGTVIRWSLLRFTWWNTTITLVITSGALTVNRCTGRRRCTGYRCTGRKCTWHRRQRGDGLIITAGFIPRGRDGNRNDDGNDHNHDNDCNYGYSFDSSPPWFAGLSDVFSGW